MIVDLPEKKDDPKEKKPSEEWIKEHSIVLTQADIWEINRRIECEEKGIQYVKEN